MVVGVAAVREVGLLISVFVRQLHPPGLTRHPLPRPVDRAHVAPLLAVVEAPVCCNRIPTLYLSGKFSPWYNLCLAQVTLHGITLLSQANHVLFVLCQSNTFKKKTHTHEYLTNLVVLSRYCGLTFVRSWIFSGY